VYALFCGDLNPLRGRLAAFKAFGRFLRKRRKVQSLGRKVRLSPLKNPLQMWRKQRVLRRRLVEQRIGEQRTDASFGSEL